MCAQARTADTDTGWGVQEVTSQYAELFFVALVKQLNNAPTPSLREIVTHVLKVGGRDWECG